MLQNESERDVFISYASEDEALIENMCRFLEARGIRCWYSKRDILPGESYPVVIPPAIRKVKVLVFVYSRFSLVSQNVNKEICLAEKWEKTVIPFRIEDCPEDGTGMEYHLSDRQWINAMPHPEQAFGYLAEAIFSSLGGTPPDTGRSAGSGVQGGTGKASAPAAVSTRSVGIPNLRSRPSANPYRRRPAPPSHMHPRPSGTGTTPQQTSNGLVTFSIESDLGYVIDPKNPCPCGSGLRYKDCCGEKVRSTFHDLNEQTERLHAAGNPVLVIFTDDSGAEIFSKMLKLRQIPHNVLVSGSSQERKQEIISSFESKGAVTVTSKQAWGTNKTRGSGPDSQFVRIQIWE